MAVQLIAFACLLAGAYAGGYGLTGHGAGHVVAHAAPVLKTVVESVDAHPKYSYSYGVEDPHTGDHKGAEEHRDGKSVHGSYWLKEADGSKRVVHYSSDPHNGFNAVVSRQHNVHPSGPIAHGHGGHFAASGHGGYGHGHASSYANIHHVADHQEAVVSHVAPIVAHAAPVYAHSGPAFAVGHSGPSAHGGHHW